MSDRQEMFQAAKERGCLDAAGNPTGDFEAGWNAHAPEDQPVDRASGERHEVRQGADSTGYGYRATCTCGWTATGASLDNVETAGDAHRAFLAEHPETGEREGDICLPCGGDGKRFPHGDCEVCGGSGRRPAEPLQDGGERELDDEAITLASQALAPDEFSWRAKREDLEAGARECVRTYLDDAAARHPHQDVERLAQVIHADDANQEGKLAEWPSLNGGERDEYRSNARAVIAALAPSPGDRGGER